MLLIMSVLILAFSIWFLPRIMIIIQCLYVYNKAIKELPEDYDSALRYLQKKGLNWGICFYLFGNCLFDFDKRVWFKIIERYNPRKDGYIYWYEPASYYNTIEEIKESLMLRRKRLIYILKRLTIFP